MRFHLPLVCPTSSCRDGSTSVWCRSSDQERHGRTVLGERDNRLAESGSEPAQADIVLAEHVTEEERSPILPDRKIGSFSSAGPSRVLRPTNKSSQSLTQRSALADNGRRQNPCKTCCSDDIDLAPVCMTMRKRRMWDAGFAFVGCSVDRDGGQRAERDKMTLSS
ncbi:serine/threonine-protein kinase ssp1 [Pseudozyma hubeiensis SY62]|uniref:Serine/threonine-protein kinase ssp1 n=1 Tax=Pseudozyma hubeiensis (strain SY62) TaxID=1305764 RepID=R9PBE2_PSEHS|nr:serine/threonine-protein kinase ssp1 [Pseudozyma hubeiensis SY62]GAC98728.1 serine/threonine-protein kinase ssp1 [Pseudozyma hubeiensis SY62]